MGGQYKLEIRSAKTSNWVRLARGEEYILTPRVGPRGTIPGLNFQIHEHSDLVGQNIVKSNLKK